MAETATVQASESALIVAVPEAEPAVGALRARLDRAAGWGVPAHVTVLYPFLAPDRIDGAVLAGVRDTVAGVPRFAVELARVAWFGDTVVWLAPSPAAPFRALTAALTRRFPGTSPYGGAFAEVVPHLTVGHDAPRAVLQAAAAAVEPHLPIRADVACVRLITGASEPGAWHTLAKFPLG